jgi:RNA polymerase sigma factor (TIGR02999 family)
MPGPEPLILTSVSEVTHILSAIEQGDPHAAEQLLPLVYDELRKLAAAHVAQENRGQTLDATALVHEAYLRLASGGREPPEAQRFENRRHFFAAAAEAMRRILIERARQKRTLKRGGDRQRIELDAVEPGRESSDDRVLAISEALDKLEQKDPRKAQLVKLRFFAGLTIEQAATVLGISPSTADNDWTYARSWLRLELESL